MHQQHHNSTSRSLSLAMKPLTSHGLSASSRRPQSAISQLLLITFRSAIRSFLPSELSLLFSALLHSPATPSSYTIALVISFTKMRVDYVFYPSLSLLLLSYHLHDSSDVPSHPQNSIPVLLFPRCITVDKFYCDLAS